MRFFGLIVFLGGLFLILIGYFGRVYIHFSVDTLLKLMGALGAVAGLVIFFGSGGSSKRRY